MAYSPSKKTSSGSILIPNVVAKIKKRRPALILSSNLYIQNTGFVIVSPITSTVRDLPGYFSLHGYDTHGQIAAAQVYSFDATPNAGRNITYIETMRDEDFYRVAQTLYYNFDFPF